MSVMNFYCLALLLNLIFLLYFFQWITIFACEKAYLDMIHWQTTQKTLRKSESSGGFFWKLFPVQRERRGQYQLIVNGEDSNIRFSNGSIGLWNSNQCLVNFKVKHKFLDGKLEFKGYEMELYSVPAHSLPACPFTTLPLVLPRFLPPSGPPVSLPLHCPAL
jgi:hypothetical protein